MPLNPVHGSRLSDSTDTPGREPVALTRSRTDDIARAQQAATPRTAAERRAAHKAMKAKKKGGPTTAPAPHKAINAVTAQGSS